MLLVIALLFAAGAGWQAHKWYHRLYETHPQRRVNLSGYEFTSPLLDIELPEGYSIRQEPLPFRHKVETFIRKKIDGRSIRQVSVYYRDLLDGPWFGINDNIEFNPASMMKIPVMIAWLKRAEKDRHVLQRRMTYVPSEHSVPPQFTKPAKTVVPGQSYSVEELLGYMMNYSDNRATSLLYKASSDKELAEVLDGMDTNNNPRDDNNAITIHGFSGFFRILFNASYLSREMSEKALQLLSLQDFPQGIAAGVPPGIKIAAKFGEIVPEGTTEDIQLHEFGIVYYPGKPYILGIMTSGRDFPRQAKLIKDISALVFKEVDANKVIK